MGNPVYLVGDLATCCTDRRDPAAMADRQNLVLMLRTGVTATDLDEALNSFRGTSLAAHVAVQKLFDDPGISWDDCVAQVFAWAAGWCDEVGWQDAAGLIRRAGTLPGWSANQLRLDIRAAVPEAQVVRAGDPGERVARCLNASGYAAFDVTRNQLVALDEAVTAAERAIRVLAARGGADVRNSMERQRSAAITRYVEAAARP